MIASDVAATPFKIYDKKKFKFDRDNADPIMDHVIYDVIENPMPGNLEMDGYTLRFLNTVYRLLIGESFWMCERDARQIPREWYPIPPNWVLTTPTVTNDYYLVVPMGNTSHKPMPIRREDVIWFKEPDISSPFGRGRARTEAIGDELETDELAAKYGKNYFYNDATPPMVIEAPGATPDMVERFKESWIQKIGGVLNARKPAVIPWKDSKITKLADSVREMDFVESRKFLRDVCNQHWAQPPELSGILENSNRSTIDSAYYLWTKNVITRELRREQAILNRQLVPMYDKTSVLVFDNVVPDDKAFDLTVANEGLARGAITVNEWRTKNGLKPDDKNGDVYLRQFSVLEVPVDGSRPVVPEEEEAAEPETVDEVDETVPVADPSAPEAKKSYSEDRRLAIWKTFDQKAASGERAFVASVKKIASKQRDEFKSSIKNASGSIESRVESAINKVFTKDADKDAMNTLKPAWLISMKSGADQAEDVLGKSYEGKELPIVVTDQFSKWVAKMGLMRAKGINDTTEDKLRTKLASTLAEGIDAGESIAGLVSRILQTTDDVYDEMDVTRANLIARTETVASVNFGQETMYKELGVEKKEWLATKDDRTRDSHIDADGQIVGIDEDFEIGEDKMSAPGLGSEASENCNCRCTILPVME